MRAGSRALAGRREAQRGFALGDVVQLPLVARHEHRCAVAVLGQCAAVIPRHPDKATELYIDEVGTASTHLRQGIATHMLDAMFEWGRELGCTEAWLGTELDNDPANGLYRRFRPVEDEAIQYYLFRL